MSTPIEVIEFTPRLVTELGEAVYNGEEPGFQVDGVTCYDELLYVFDALRNSVPKTVRRQMNFKNGLFMNPENPELHGPHIDRGYCGFAVHQNLTDDANVILALPVEWGRTSVRSDYAKDCFDDGEFARCVRTGETIPGRLTVFSEGNRGLSSKPFGSLTPTIHYFERVSEGRQNLWSRYTTSESILTSLFTKWAYFRETMNVRKIAKKSFELVARSDTV